VFWRPLIFVAVKKYFTKNVKYSQPDDEEEKEGNESEIKLPKISAFDAIMLQIKHLFSVIEFVDSPFVISDSILKSHQKSASKQKKWKSVEKPKKGKVSMQMYTSVVASLNKLKESYSKLKNINALKDQQIRMYQFQINNIQKYIDDPPEDDKNDLIERIRNLPPHLMGKLSLKAKTELPYFVNSTTNVVNFDKDLIHRKEFKIINKLINGLLRNDKINRRRKQTKGDSNALKTVENAPEGESRKRGKKTGRKGRVAGDIVKECAKGVPTLKSLTKQYTDKIIKQTREDDILESDSDSSVSEDENLPLACFKENTKQTSETPTLDSKMIDQQAEE
jgi:hypothetical protein